MDLRISKLSGVPVRQQLAEQILLHIVTGRLKPGFVLPSVRELARRLKIHHNTVSEAYRDLVRRQWLARRQGSHLTVCGVGKGLPLEGPLTLDDIVHQAIRSAREQGYTPHEIRRHVLAILTQAPPDHILVVAEEAGLRQLLQLEIQQTVKWPVESCSEENVARNPGLANRALVTTPAFALPRVEPLVSKKRPPIPLSFGTPDFLAREVAGLSKPSVIAVVSASNVCLRAAAGLLGPVIGEQHSLVELLWPLEDPGALAGADLVLCDSLAALEAKKKRCVPYQLIDPASIQYLQLAMASYQEN